MTRLVEFLTLVPPCFFFFLFLFFSPPLPFLRRKKGERERGGRLCVTEIGGRLDLGLWYAFRRDFFEMEQVLLVSSEIGNGRILLSERLRVFLRGTMIHGKFDWPIYRSIFHLLDSLFSNCLNMFYFKERIEGIEAILLWKFRDDLYIREEYICEIFEEKRLQWKKNSIDRNLWLKIWNDKMGVKEHELKRNWRNHKR